jgi:transcriptional regulator with XRE-family HTH domain
MTRLSELLGDEFQTAEAQLYRELAREDQHLLARLVEIRKERGLSQEDVAEALGLSQATISAFERVGNDPHLSTVRRYCRAIGVMVRHYVDEDGSGCDDSHYLSHVSSRGIRSVDTAAAVARNMRRSQFEWPTTAVSPKPPKTMAEMTA